MADSDISFGEMKPLLFVNGLSLCCDAFLMMDGFSDLLVCGFVAFGFAFGTIGGFVAFGFAFGTIGGFVGTFGVATALITLSGLGASVFRINHNDHFMIPFSIRPPSSFIIC